MSLCARVMPMVTILAFKAFGQSEPGVTNMYDDPYGNTHVVCMADGTQTYELYIPASAPATNAPILYCFDPAGNGKSVLISLAAAAEAHGWIIAASNNSKNGPWSVIFDAQDAVLADTEARLDLHPTRRFATGFSGGARASLALAFRYPDKLAGVLCLGAGWPVNTGLTPSTDDLVVRIICGVYDSNYGYDIPTTQGQLVDYGIRCDLVSWNAGHTFPPANLILEAAEWLDQHAETDPNAGVTPQDCSNESFVCQTPSALESSWNSYYSDSLYDESVFENFEGATGAIEEITFWGFAAEFNYYWLPREPDSDEFLVSLHPDNGGAPGPAVHSETVIATRDDQTALYNNNFRLLKYTVQLNSPVTLPSGWVRIQHQAETSTVFLWLTSPDGDGNLLSYNSVDDAYVPYANDLAVSLGAQQLLCDFDALPTIGAPPHNVQFTANVTGADLGAVSWLWDFGDGATSTVGPVVSHEYTTTGEYTVTLSVSADTRNAQTVKTGYIRTSEDLPAVSAGALALLACSLAGASIAALRRSRV